MSAAGVPEQPTDNKLDQHEDVSEGLPPSTSDATATRRARRGRLYKRVTTEPVEAMQFTGENFTGIKEWIGTRGDFFEIADEDRGANPDAVVELWVAANSTWTPMEPMEWIIRDRHGFYPCKADVFAAGYTFLGTRRDGPDESVASERQQADEDELALEALDEYVADRLAKEERESS